MGTKSSQEGLLFLPHLVSFLPCRLTWATMLISQAMCSGLCCLCFLSGLGLDVI